VTVGGSLLGGSGDLSGALAAISGGIGAVTVTGDVVGSAAISRAKSWPPPISFRSRSVAPSVSGSGDYAGGTIGSVVIPRVSIAADNIGLVSIGRDFQGIPASLFTRSPRG
jgi:hypothetical protein